MKPAFTLIEVLSATLILSIVMAISFQSVNYMNNIHHQNEIRYLALNRLDSEMSRLAMAMDMNYTNSGDTSYKNGNGHSGTEDDEYGLKITTSDENFVQLKDIGGNDIVEDGDFVAILSWNKSGDDIELTLKYPYIYRTGDTLHKLWDFDEEINLKTSIKS
jgi:prepilin-type N-terminal cleavage/methylation domain-containing protein